jgi:uncharacterized MAPEG superfamily protein
MTIADLCLLGAVLLVLLSIMPAKIRGRAEFNNARPRDPSFYRDAFRTRALGAHQNGFESFPFFATAVLLAEMRSAPQPWVNALAVGYLVARAAYVGCYLGDKPTPRSVMWTLAFACNVGIFFLPLAGH